MLIESFCLDEQLLEQKNGKQNNFFELSFFFERKKNLVVMLTSFCINIIYYETSFDMIGIVGFKLFRHDKHMALTFSAIR